MLRSFLLTCAFLHVAEALEVLEVLEGLEVTKAVRDIILTKLCYVQGRRLLSCPLLTLELGIDTLATRR